jgi:hypothetical protein
MSVWHDHLLLLRGDQSVGAAKKSRISFLSAFNAFHAPAAVDAELGEKGS